MYIASNTNAVGVACLLTPEGCNYSRKDYTAPSRGCITFIFQLIFGLINFSGSVDDLGLIFHFLPFGSPIVEKKQL
ncbi:hypothetical protein, partial [Sphingobacterium sp. 1.A.5]|uniref:hypothetical protein n=1 Tax=Sphingobacterium sp. 1.A.5 TaxID=2044604 RepID=UPI001C559101